MILRQCGLADAGWAPQNHRRNLISLDSGSQRLAGIQKMPLSDDFVECSRTHAIGQRRACCRQPPAGRLRREIRSSSPLFECFVQNHRYRYCRIQRLDRRLVRNPQHGITVADFFIRESATFVSHQNGRRLIPIPFVDYVSGLRRCTDNRKISLPQRWNYFVQRCARKMWKTKQTSGAGANGLPVMKVCRARERNTSRCAEGFGHPQDRADVAGVLKTRECNQKRRSRLQARPRVQTVWDAPSQ